jgi:hypothetical protein
MRSELANALRKYFAKQLKQKWPSFNETKNNDLPVGCRLYKLKLATDFTFYLLLQPSSKDESFTLELAWTQKDTFPLIASHTILPHGEPINGEHLKVAKIFLGTA